MVEIQELEQAAKARRRGAVAAAADEQSGGGEERSRRSDYKRIMQGGKEPLQPQRMNRAEEARNEADGAITNGSCKAARSRRSRSG